MEKRKVFCVGKDKLDLREDLTTDDNLAIIFESDFYTQKEAFKHWAKLSKCNIIEYLLTQEQVDTILSIKKEQNQKDSIYIDDDNTIYVQGYNHGDVDLNALKRKYGA